MPLINRSRNLVSLALCAAAIVALSVFFILNYRKADAKVSLHSAPLVSNPASAASSKSFNVYVSDFLSPKKNHEYFRPLAESISSSQGLPLRMATGKFDSRYVAEMLNSGECRLAFVDPAVFDFSAVDFAARAVPLKGESCDALLVAPASSLAESVAGLSGGFLMMNQRDDLGSVKAVSAGLARMGEDPARFFKGWTYTDGFDTSLGVLARGMADAAVVNGFFYKKIVEEEGLEGRLKIVDRTGPAACPVMVVSKTVGSEQAAEILKTVTGLDESEEGKRALAALGASGFQAVEMNVSARAENQNER